MKERMQIVATLLLLLIGMNSQAVARVSTDRASCQNALKPSTNSSDSESARSTPALSKKASKSFDLLAIVAELTAGIKLSRAANEMGFTGKQDLRALSRQEALQIASVMKRFEKTDAATTVANIKKIQSVGDFQKFDEIINVLGNAYASKLQVKGFAIALRKIQENLLVPTESEMGFNAQDLRSPDLEESMRAFNLLISRKGDLSALQEELLDAANIVDTGDAAVLISLIEEADEMGVSSGDLASTVAHLRSELKITKSTIGFGSATDTVTPSPSEAVAIYVLGSQLASSPENLLEIVKVLQGQMVITDYATLINGLSNLVKAQSSQKTEQN